MWGDCAKEVGVFGRWEGLKNSSSPRLSTAEGLVKRGSSAFASIGRHWISDFAGMTGGRLLRPSFETQKSNECFVSWRVGLSGPSMDPTPSRLRATGLACGCPILFQTKWSNPGGFSPSRHHQKSKTPHEGAFCFFGGEGGIRTHGTLTRTPDFESGTFDHSATSPKAVRVVHASRQSYADGGVLTTGFAIPTPTIYCRATPQRSPRGR